MGIRSYRAVVGGILLAIALPILYAVLGTLITNGALSLERSSALFAVLHNLGVSAMAQLGLGVLGARVMGSGLGLQHPVAWLALVIVVVLATGFAWFVGFALFGGAMGSPF